jgi:hypothetical protein
MTNSGNTDRALARIREATAMHHVLPENQRFLRDAVGIPIIDGACVLDDDREVGYVRLDLSPVCPGPESAYWDGWFHVTRTREEHPLRGKVLNGPRVQVIRSMA